MISQHYIETVAGLLYTKVDGPVHTAFKRLVEYTNRMSLRQTYHETEQERVLLSLKKLARACVNKYASLKRVSEKTVLQRLADIHVNKNAGYSGDSIDTWKNLRRCQREFGISIIDGILTRMCDKMSRYETLCKDPSKDKVGESLADTLLDLAAYSIILYVVLREECAADDWYCPNGGMGDGGWIEYSSKEDEYANVS